MKPGTKPTPTALKKLRGNPGRRALPENEPTPAISKRVPSAPRHLSDNAKKYWKREAKKLHDAGILTEVDLMLFETMCVAMATGDEAMELVNDHGLVIKTTNGNVIQSPALGIANRAYDRATKIALEFGMTPSSRTRLQVERPHEEPSLAEALNSILKTDKEVYQAATVDRSDMGAVKQAA